MPAAGPPVVNVERLSRIKVTHDNYNAHRAIQLMGLACVALLIWRWKPLKPSYTR